MRKRRIIAGILAASLVLQTGMPVLAEDLIIEESVTESPSEDREEEGVDSSSLLPEENSGLLIEEITALEGAKTDGEGPGETGDTGLSVCA